MTPQQHQRVKALFTAASRLEPGAPRVALLDQQCPDDAEVRAEVVALLSADDDPIGSLKTPALGVNIGKTLGAALRAMGPTEMPTRLGVSGQISRSTGSARRSRGGGGAAQHTDRI